MSAEAERTLAIIKPDAVGKRVVGRVLAQLEEAGFEIREMRMLRLTVPAAREFYAVHAEQPFYDSLVEFMTSDRCVPLVVERDDAVAELRRVIGTTDPAEAASGTVRARFGGSVERNAIHASDSRENAAREIEFFFGPERRA